jgi:hypothetical protein
VTGATDMTNLRDRVPTPKIGLLPVGHFYYWDQFPRLRELGLSMNEKLRSHLAGIGSVIASELVIMIVFPFGYTPSMCVVPAVQDLDVPLRILNAHDDSSYDYRKADTTEYLHHEGVCCVPEISGALVY